jgi:hypothetical protein
MMSYQVWREGRKSISNNHVHVIIELYLKPAQAKPPNPTATVRLATTALGVVECATASRNSV